MQQKTVLKYFNLAPLGPVGARGAAVRLYMKVHNIPFEEESVELADWGAPSGKPACMKDHNPTGSLPVLFMGGKAYAEHVAMCRYLARKTGQYGKDPEADFMADAAADAYNDWMNAWASLIGKGETDDAVKEYRSTRSKFYKVLEWYYAKKSSPSSAFLIAGALPGFVDLLVWNRIRDDALSHTPVDLSAYPNLKALSEAVGSLPEVKSWVAKVSA